MAQHPYQYAALNDFVICKLEVPKDVTTGGIIVPDSAQKPSAWAKVLVVPDTVKFVEIGDEVLIRDSSTFSKAGPIVTHESSVYISAKEDGLIACKASQIITKRRLVPVG